MACLQNAQKVYFLTQRHHIRPRVSCLEAIETIIWKLPIAPVVLIVSKYWGDRDDPDDHLETRLKVMFHETIRNDDF